MVFMFIAIIFSASYKFIIFSSLSRQLSLSIKLSFRHDAVEIFIEFNV